MKRRAIYSSEAASRSDGDEEDDNFLVLPAVPVASFKDMSYTGTTREESRSINVSPPAMPNSARLRAGPWKPSRKWFGECRIKPLASEASTPLMRVA